MQNKNTWGLTKGFILASNSPQRLRLLQSAGFEPVAIIGADIDESEKAREKPVAYVARMAREKAAWVAHQNPNTCIVAADTIIVARGKIIRKAANESVARHHLDILSNAKHHVLTGYSIVFPNGKQKTQVIDTTVYMKPITDAEKNALIASGEWKNVAGYRIEGMLSTFVMKIKGSFPNIVGLPIYEVAEDLKKALK